MRFPQGRALFQHLNFRKGCEHPWLYHFDFEMHFTPQPVHFLFEQLNFQKLSNTAVLLTFDIETCFAPHAACNLYTQCFATFLPFLFAHFDLLSSDSCSSDCASSLGLTSKLPSIILQLVLQHLTIQLLVVSSRGQFRTFAPGWASRGASRACARAHAHCAKASVGQGGKGRKGRGWGSWIASALLRNHSFDHARHYNNSCL